MIYTNNYEDRIVMRYGVSLQGWPLPTIKNPSNIARLGDLNSVLDALKEGCCHWKQLTSEEFLERKQQLQQEVDAGTRDPLRYGDTFEFGVQSSRRPQKRHKIG